ncbi:MAG: PTS mannose/fructose/sorbose transporter subunit IIB [Gemmatimonadales bacterium]|nr:MAG: PTS mannose/fructose/sorbose transporter subunit IIB [Gemmatimonadales bacterium]
MPIALFRVDERLIHGQVTVGWGIRLDPVRYVVVDDLLAGSEWEQELYRLGTPSGVEVRFLGVADAVAELARFENMNGVTILLTRTLPAMAQLAEGGAMEGREVNLGGIHHAPGRESVLPYLSLGDAERDSIRALLDAGVEVVARDLPGSAGVGGERFVE